MIDVSTIKEADTIIKKAHFLAQCHHESMGFKVKEENLNYSAKALLYVFRRYYTPELARKEEYNKVAIGNRVYGHRMLNNGEGFKYRGRGYLQLTGRENYINFSRYIGYDCENDPDVVALCYPLESAAWYFNENNLWKICTDIEEDTIKKVTLRINGGFNGLNDRIKLTKEYYDKLLLL